MTIASNSYAEKVFAEHPIGLWSLDDEVGYLSMITEDDREMNTGWTFKDTSDTTITPSPASIYTSDSPGYLFGSVINDIAVPNSLTGSTNTIKAISPVLFQESDFSESLKTFAIGMYIYNFDEKDLSVTYGVEYTDGTTKRLTKIASLPKSTRWGFISARFDVPSSFSNMKIVIEVTYNGPTTSYSFLIHGLSFGQWSEQFHAKSLGGNATNLPASIPLQDDLLGISASSYGLNARNGYFIVEDNTLKAVQSGLPMVYGTGNSTILKPTKYRDENTIVPSLILPGYGFMGKDGQYSDLTLEMWLKIQSLASEPRKIVGPLSSKDGLYVNDSFLSLKVGTEFGSYFVAEWDRPMLVAIRIGKSSASLVLNGEEVISLSLSSDIIDFPERFVNQLGIEVDNDWIGFYAYQDVPQIEIDCVGIYPYIVPKLMAKRRLIYGQGVSASANISGSDQKSTVTFDFPTARYAKNYLYPDLGRWVQGAVDNLVVENKYLALPEYTAPELKFDNKTYDEWVDVVKNDQGTWGTSISLKPSTGQEDNSWANTNGYVYLPTISAMSQETKAIYAIFEPNNSDIERQTLLFFQNNITSESLEVALQGNEISYTLKTLNLNGTIQETIIQTDSYDSANQVLLITGINIDKFIGHFGGKFLSFWGNKQNISVYVGGSPEFQTTYSGKIYRIALCTSRNLQKITNIFDERGLIGAINDANLSSSQIKNAGPVTQSSWEEVLDGGEDYFGNSGAEFEAIVDGGSVQSITLQAMLDHVASYTVLPKILFDQYVIDIAVNGYWQDYLPLTYFTRTILGEDEESYPGLDFIQFNVGYPSLFKFLNNAYDTSNAIIKTYISFQPMTKRLTINPNDYLYTERASATGVVSPGGNWLQTKYEVVDGMIIYPPSNANIEQLAIVIHIEVISSGIIENPIRLQTLQLASQAFNTFTPTPIGTKFGRDIYPYTRSGSYYHYKRRNPFSIYKGSTPYFYLTGSSGIRLRGNIPDTVERGITVPINQSRSVDYSVGAIQMAVRYENEIFSENAEEIIEIYANPATTESDNIIKFIIVPESSDRQRGVIHAIDGNTGLKLDGITFYINGVPMTNAIINLRTWTLLTVVFAPPLDFSRATGAIRVTGSIMFDNLSLYKSEERDAFSRVVYRRWSGVLGEDQPWDFWTAYTWREVLFTSSEAVAGLNGTELYQKYTGTNRITVDSDITFRLRRYRYALYPDIKWQSSIVVPA